ncbi:MAG: serine hydrolase [Pseudomonadota bacterium]
MIKSTRAAFFAILLLVGVALLLLSCESSTDAAEAPADSSELQTWIDNAINDGDSLSISAMMREGDEVTYYSGGAITPDGAAPDENTQYQIGSITKVFTNMLLAELVAEGKLGYATTLGELMGDDVSFANDQVADITVEELATHTSGLARMPANFTPSDPQNPYKDYTAALLTAEIASARSQQLLVNDYGYSNLGQGLLGYQLGLLEGSSYREAVADRVIQPLGLEETGFDGGDNLADGFRGGVVVPAWLLPEPFAAAGALWGSTSDFDRLARVMLGQTDSPFSHDITAVRDTVAQAGPDFDVSRVWHKAYAGDQPIYWHNGGTGGFLSFFGFRPDTRQAVAILVAGGDAPYQQGLTLLGSTDLNRPAPEIDESVFGQYELAPGMSAGVFEQNGVLVSQITGQAPVRLHGGDVDDFYALKVADASVRFLREDGEVTGMELIQYGRVMPASRVADEAQSTDKTEVELADAALSDYAGEFAVNPIVKFTIRESDDGLTAQLTGQSAFPIFYKGDDVFFYKVVDAELHFERDEANAVTALTLYQGAIVQRAERIE